MVQVLTSVADNDGGVAVSLAASQHALVAILKLLEFKEFKHKDFNKSGQHLLWRELPWYFANRTEQDSTFHYIFIATFLWVLTR